jgi:hypothetical protein
MINLMIRKFTFTAINVFTIGILALLEVIN